MQFILSTVLQKEDKHGNLLVLMLLFFFDVSVFNAKTLDLM
jgi:hypothetical protein